MRPAAAVLMLFAIGCSTAIGQGRAPGPGPADREAVAATPVLLPARAPVTAVERRRAAAHADARVCLEFPTQAEVIACAQKYRWAKGR
ncbi:MAG: hypothetical protein ACREYD_15715 [Casimicrobiaceae bacterium]